MRYVLTVAAILAVMAWNAFEVAGKPAECAGDTPAQATGNVGDSSEQYDDRVYQYLKDRDYRLARKPMYYM